MSHPDNRGYGGAVRSGLEAAEGDAVFFTDADRQFRLADIERLLPAFETADLVAGYRLKRSDPWIRLFIARTYRVLLRATLGSTFRDVDCAFKLIRRDVIDSVLPRLEARSPLISAELLLRTRRAGYRVVEVGVPHHPRTAGKAKGAPPRVILQTLGEMLRLRGRISETGAR